MRTQTLRKIYKSLIEEQGSPSNEREPHSTWFSEHRSLIPEWTEFSQENEISISHSEKRADMLIKAHDSQIDQDYALLLMRAAVILHKNLQNRNPSVVPSHLTVYTPLSLMNFAVL